MRQNKPNQTNKKHHNGKLITAPGLKPKATKAEYLHCNVWKLPICGTLFLRVEKYCGFLSYCFLNLEVIQKHHSSMAKAE